MCPPEAAEKAKMDAVQAEAAKTNADEVAKDEAAELKNVAKAETEANDKAATKQVGKAKDAAGFSSVANTSVLTPSPFAVCPVLRTRSAVCLEFRLIKLFSFANFLVLKTKRAIVSTIVSTVKMTGIAGASAPSTT